MTNIEDQAEQPQPLNSEPTLGPVEGRRAAEIRADLACCDRDGVPWPAAARRLLADVPALLAEVEAAHRFERSVAVDSAEMSLAQQFLDGIVAERHRAHAKHGVTSMEQSDDLAHRRVSILLEEIAECAKALNDHEHGELYLEPTRNGWHGPGAEDDLDKELIQVGAMAYTWWANRHGDRLAAAADAPQPEDDEKCPRDGQSAAWHRYIGGTRSDGSPRTNGEFVGCWFGVPS